MICGLKNIGELGAKQALPTTFNGVLEGPGLPEEVPRRLNHLVKVIARQGGLRTS